MSGTILAILEQRGGAWHRMSFETLAAAQQLAAEFGYTASAAVPVALANELAAYQLDRVYQIEHELLKEYAADAYAAAVEQLIRKVQPAIVLFPHTYQVRDFAPKVATRFNQVLISDVTAVRNENGPVFVRQLFQGKLKADVRLNGAGPYLASIQAGAYRADQVAPGTAPVEAFTPEIKASDVRQRPQEPFRETAGAVDLTAAELIVSVGRGIKEQDNIPLVQELATVLGAELAATRPVCDSGWLPIERQVGSSGQTVSPKAYIAIGISGAIQHLVGMKGAKTVIAINKDPDAPIFEVADYGIVGDLFEVVPALVEGLKKANSAGA